MHICATNKTCTLKNCSVQSGTDKQRGDGHCYMPILALPNQLKTNFLQGPSPGLPVLIR